MAKKKRAVTGTREQGYRKVMAQAIALRWAELWKEITRVKASEDPEAVHDVRVASRRLRAAMDVATDAFPQKWYRRLHKSAKAITGALGDVRDRDVMLEVLRAERAHADEREWLGLDYLIQQLETERDEAREAMATFLRRLKAKGVRKESRQRFPLPSRKKGSRR